MNIQIIYVKGEDGIITDMVGLSDYAKASKLAQELSAQFGRFNVTHTSLIVDELPTFFGNTSPSEAVEQSVQRTATPYCECGATVEIPHAGNCPNRKNRRANASR